jgi:hypothetical protein
VGDFAPEIVLDVNIDLLYSGRQKTLSMNALSKKKQSKLPDLKARKDPKAGGGAAPAPRGPAGGGG